MYLTDPSCFLHISHTSHIYVKNIGFSTVLLIIMSARCIFFICCSLGDGLVMHLWTLMDLWIYLDRLEHLLLYM